MFNSYLVGELNVDFFDANNEPDMAVSSRQGVQENDPRFDSFMGYLKSRMVDIAKQWDEWRREIGAPHVISEFPKIQEWIDGLKRGRQVKARQLIGRTYSMRFSGDEVEQKEQKREVIKQQILAFEKLEIKDNIESIGSIDIERNIKEFGDILISVEDIESLMHHDIVSQRLAVVNKLQEHSASKVRERVVQDHIYRHLWLVDPSWEHKEEPSHFELTLTEYLKKACPDTTEGARLDIGYRTTAGKYIVIELKRPGLPVKINDLIDQGRKYSTALKQYFYENPDSSPSVGQIPVIEIVFLIDKNPTIPLFDKDYYERELLNLNASVRTYTDLINHAQRAYDEYLKASKRANKLREITESL